MIGIFSPGIKRIPHLQSFLGHAVSYRPGSGQGLVSIAGWGRKRTADRAIRASQEWDLPYISLEDGFLRSLGLGSQGFAPLALVVDDVGTYYDATRPSKVETLLEGTGWENPELLRRTEGAISKIITNRLSKYNHAPDRLPVELETRGAGKRVLVVDQTYGDMSVALGLADAKSFMRMFDKALADNPEAEVWVKAHPEVIAGKKKGYLCGKTCVSRTRVIGTDVNPLTLLSAFDEVYTVSSQLGFEALLLGKRVRCFGMPFYAGWGVTDDALTCSRRTRRRSVSEIFAAAYILCSRYVDPYTGRACEIEDTVALLSLLRKKNEVNRLPTVGVGFSRWKRRYIRAFLGAAGGKVSFVSSGSKALRAAARQGGRIAVWASREPRELAEAAKAAGIPLVRMEDGFLRSRGLGSDFHAPYSLVLDSRGIYYAGDSESDLEYILNTASFDNELLVRAKRLREEVVRRKLSKYNVGGRELLKRVAEASRHVVLVPGQVENDASIRRGSPVVQNNLTLLRRAREENPESFIIYKPHPDVESGNRSGLISDEIARVHCDLVVQDASMAELLGMVDAVHTMTSLTGFEALLRGVHVTTYGTPFYAGWGLTTDHLPILRRVRRLSLDELVAGTLILYPSYYDWQTGLFCTPEIVIERLASATRSTEIRNEHVLQRLPRAFQRYARALPQTLFG